MTTPPGAQERAAQATRDCEHVGYYTDQGSWDHAYAKRGACEVCIADALAQAVQAERERMDATLIAVRCASCGQTPWVVSGALQSEKL